MVSRRSLFLAVLLVAAVVTCGGGAASGCSTSAGATVSTAQGAAGSTTATSGTGSLTASSPTASEATTATELETTSAQPATTTTSEPTTTTIETTTTMSAPDPAGWRRYSAGGISGALPASFKGGLPDGAALAAEAKLFSNGKAWLSWWKDYFTSYKDEPLLGFLEDTTRKTYAPSVWVTRSEEFPVGSLADYTSPRMGIDVEPAGSTVTLVSRSDDREVWMIVRPYAESTYSDKIDYHDTLMWVFIKTGRYIYSVDYQCHTPGFKHFEQDFKASAAGIRIGPETDPGATTTT